MSKILHEISCELIRESPSGLAWLIDDGDKEVWIPKSQAELFPRADGSYVLSAPEWLLKEKGLI